MTPAELRLLLRIPDRRHGAAAPLSCRVEETDSYLIEQIVFDFGDGQPVRGLLTGPKTADAPCPGVLYCHAHGARYEIGASELLDGRPSLIAPYGPELARRGFVSLCIDMPTFGERRHLKEDAFAKAELWRGRTVMGLMLADLLSAFDHLASRPDVDAQRIATLGLSMGATHAYFLAAIEPRIARLAHLCCFADLATLIESGGHDLHGPYMTVPGLLEATSFGRIAGMAAPRPQLICVGAQDPLTPPLAVERAYGEARAAYAAAGATDALSLLVEPESGHRETPAMRAAVLEFLARVR